MGFLTRVGQTIIIIERPRGETFPSMRITDESGKVLETVGGPVWGEDGTEFLSELYELARRQALKVDELCQI